MRHNAKVFRRIICLNIRNCDFTQTYHLFILQNKNAPQVKKVGRLLRQLYDIIGDSLRKNNCSGEGLLKKQFPLRELLAQDL